MEEREQDRQRVSQSRKLPVDLEKQRRLESLKLARVEMTRQRAATIHAGRQQQLALAIEALDFQISELASAADAGRTGDRKGAKKSQGKSGV
jgi:hypothetical protein